MRWCYTNMIAAFSSSVIILLLLTSQCVVGILPVVSGPPSRGWIAEGSPIAEACLKGCTLIYNPVVDKRGITFQNHCIAKCQGFNDVKECPSVRAADEHRTSATPSLNVSKECLQRFSTEKFVFVGRVERTSLPIYRPQLDRNLNQTSRALCIDPSEVQSIVRITSEEGNRYVKVQGDDVYNWTRLLEPDIRKLGLLGRRMSALHDGDSRQEVTSMNYPYSTVGQVWGDDGKNEVSCTGTLISKHRILTAAHCFFNRNVRQQSIINKFSLLRRGRRAEQTYDIEWYTYNRKFEDSEQDADAVLYDLAVGWLKPHKDLDHAATLPIYQDCQAFNLNVTSVGYPMDLPSESSRRKDQGYFQYESQCTISAPNTCDTTTNIIYHTCDILAGQSGSPMWTYKNGSPYLVAVVSSTAKEKGIEASVQLTKYWQDFINKMIAASSPVDHTLRTRP